MNLPITCIIPCRNGAATIVRAVESAVGAGCDSVRVYDDASSDDSARLWRRLSMQFSNVEVFSISARIRVGVHFARNYLIEDAPTGLIIPLDADDKLRNIQPLVDAYEPGTWVYGDHVEHDGGIETRYQGAAPGALPRKNITGVTFLFHTDDWLKAGGYDPDFAYAEDYAFQLALMNVGVHPKYVPTVVYDRYLHPHGNERTALANVYWTFYQQMARRKYPAVFAGTG